VTDSIPTITRLPAPFPERQNLRQSPPTRRGQIRRARSDLRGFVSISRRQ
jgi:hypothetical protein